MKQFISRLRSSKNITHSELCACAPPQRHINTSSLLFCSTSHSLRNQKSVLKASKLQLMICVALFSKNPLMHIMRSSSPAFQNQKTTGYMCVPPRLRVCTTKTKTTGCEQCAFFCSCLPKPKSDLVHVRSSAFTCVYCNNNGVCAV